MRLINTLMSSAAMLLFSSTIAMAAPMTLLQDSAQPPVRVDVHTTETHTVWYTDPVWLALGALAVLLVIVLAVMAARNRDSGGSSTTVIR